MPYSFYPRLLCIFACARVKPRKRAARVCLCALVSRACTCAYYRAEHTAVRRACPLSKCACRVCPLSTAMYLRQRSSRKTKNVRSPRVTSHPGRPHTPLPLPPHPPPHPQPNTPTPPTPPTPTNILCARGRGRKGSERRRRRSERSEPSGPSLPSSTSPLRGVGALSSGPGGWCERGGPGARKPHIGHRPAHLQQCGAPFIRRAKAAGALMGLRRRRGGALMKGGKRTHAQKGWRHILRAKYI